MFVVYDVLVFRTGAKKKTEIQLLSPMEEITVGCHRRRHALAAVYWADQ